jgi:NAD(P)-dependent dehydrogenase (short-subunit alcohol dehydrogenase family)
MVEGGRIITIGSSIAAKVPYAGVSLYAMSKAALTGLTKGLAHDLADRGITVNVVAPGSTDTEMNPADGELADDERALIPLGRYGRPEDVAGAVAFLAARSTTIAVMARQVPACAERISPRTPDAPVLGPSMVRLPRCEWPGPSAWRL